MYRKGRIRWLAVLAGYLLDTILSLIIAAIAVSIEPNIARNSFFASPVGVITGVLLAAATVVGGWLAGRLAKEERFLHGFMVGGLGIFRLLIDSFSGAPLLLDAILLQFLATALAGVAGYSSRWVPARQRK